MQAYVIFPFQPRRPFSCTHQNTLHTTPTVSNNVNNHHRQRITLPISTAPEQLILSVEISPWLVRLQPWARSPTSHVYSEQSESKSHTMASRFRAWLRRKLKLSGKTQYRETASGRSNPQTAAPGTRKESPPPPYATLDLLPRSTHQPPRSIDGSESIEVLRTRNPATRPPSEQIPILRAPRRMTRPNTAVKAAASTAVIGMIRALDEPNPKMVAARTAQAIAVAVSTSRSYAAFVAACYCS